MHKNPSKSILFVNYFQVKIILLFITILFIIGCGKVAHKKSDKIIVLSPEVAEIVYEIGAKDQVLAVTNECDYPPEIENIPKVGSFSSPDIEKIIALRPKYILGTSLEQAMVFANMKKLHLKCYEFYPQSIDSLYNAIMKIGSLFNKEMESQKLVHQLRMDISSINIPNYQPRVYIEIYNSPLMTASSESFVGDIISKAGGKNIFNQLPREYCRITAEEIISRNPQVIIITYPNITKNDVSNRLGWDKIDAVINKQIYTVEDINPDFIVRAGPRFVIGVKQLAQLFKNAVKGKESEG
ncbi:MAG: hypothetical protein DRH57_02915 [Candidatus Cloacimonadota bacterium]|nr:MAG: hypothetical protein DRH57_02915 [Candidatus Cloacimonadota bacterium]